MDLSNPVFHDDAKARKWLEAHVWPNGPICPHCGNSDRNNITALLGKAHRPGLFKCNECREQFTVTVGTVMERSKIPLHKWALAMFLMAASKKGISAHQLHRTMNVSYKTAWFMCHRIREAMRDKNLSPLGGGGKIVEADETYFGTKEDKRTFTTAGRRFTKGGRTGPSNKRAVLGLVERGGKVRTFHVQHATAESVAAIVNKNIKQESRLHTDESRIYVKLGANFAKHETITHSAREYARGDVHTNSIEGVFSIFKRGMKGVYHHCGEAHLHRYLAEFDFRYNRRIALGVDDTGRVSQLARGARGKRLMYQRTSAADNV
jgi:transposase-like protein